VPLARLALAVFPVPERLARADETALAATRAAGQPLLVRPGEKGTGLLRTHSLAAGAVDIQSDLNKLWVLRRKGELATALTSASDACTRTALGLVR
jgi:flagellar hook protein FlgE